FAGLVSYDLKLRSLSARLGLQLFPGAGDRIKLIIKELFDTQSDLYIPSPIAPLAGPVLLRRELWKLCFPVSQDVGLHPYKIANLADLKVDFLRYSHGCLSHSCR